MFGDSSLPPGCTTQDCEGGPEQFCANCGHSEQDHYEQKNGSDPCDNRIPATKSRVAIDCECPGYVEGEYEPDHNDGRDD